MRSRYSVRIWIMASDCNRSDSEAEEELYEKVTHYLAEGTYPPGRPRWPSRRSRRDFRNVKWRIREDMQLLVSGNVSNVLMYLRLPL